MCSAIDNYTGEKVAIKKINNVFEHVSDATRILREIKLLRLLKHPGAWRSTALRSASAVLSGCGCREAHHTASMHLLGLSCSHSSVHLLQLQTLWRSSTLCCPQAPGTSRTST